jgi:hypothetical protein
MRETMSFFLKQERYVFLLSSTKAQEFGVCESKWRDRRRFLRASARLTKSFGHTSVASRWIRPTQRLASWLDRAISGRATAAFDASSSMFFANQPSPDVLGSTLEDWVGCVSADLPHRSV